MKAYLTRDLNNSNTYISFGEKPELDDKSGKFSFDGDVNNFYNVNDSNLEIPCNVGEKECVEVEVIVKLNNI